VNEDRALQLLHSGSEDQKEAAATQLMAIGEPAVAGLRAALQSGDADARWWAARALAGVPAPSAAQALLAALSDPDEDVRICAVMGIGERRQAAAVDQLLGMLSQSGGYLARHVADALSKIGEAAVPGLVQALEDPRATVRVQAARALVRIESQQAIPALIKSLDDPEPAVEHYAWEALQRMGVGVTFLFQP
jgi:HEAT repeat protein